MQNTTKTKPHAPRRRFNPTPRLQPGAAPGTVMPLKDSAPASVSVLTVNHGQVSGPVLLKNLKQLPFRIPTTATASGCGFVAWERSSRCLRSQSIMNCPAWLWPMPLTPDGAQKWKKAARFCFLCSRLPCCWTAAPKTNTFLFFVKAT